MILMLKITIHSEKVNLQITNICILCQEKNKNISFLQVEESIELKVSKKIKNYQVNKNIMFMF
jgi:hypothetical protein